MGSIEKRGKKYIMRTVVGYKPNGNPIRKSKTAAATNKRDAVKELTLWEIALESESADKKQLPNLSEFVDEWLNKYAREVLKTQTVARYIEILNGRYLPVLGDKLLNEITPLDIQQIISTAKNLRTGDELTQRSKVIIKSAIKSVFDAALDWELVDRNPCDRAKIGKGKAAAKQNEPYSELELIDLFEKLEDERIRTRVIITLAIVTGGRAGEIGALQNKHINYADRRITFEQTVINTHGQGFRIQNETKTNTVKEMYMPDPVLDLLQEFDAEMHFGPPFRNLSDRDGYLFGKFLSAATVGNVFRNFVKKHKLREIRFHDLRHTSASYLYNQGVALKEIQNMLGHKNINTTASIYTHTNEEKKRITAEIFGNVMKK